MRHVTVVRSAVLLAVATLACVPAHAQVPGRLGERHALLVGVRQYDPNELRSLPYSEPDVTELAQVLKDAGYRQVVTLTQTAGAANFRLLPTGANIRTTLKGMLADRDPGDTVLVAFAGHGSVPGDAGELLLPDGCEARRPPPRRLARGGLPRHGTLRGRSQAPAGRLLPQ